MHCMVSWGSPVVGVPLEPTDYSVMEKALVGLDYVKVFEGTVVITIGSEQDRINLQERLTEASKSIGNRAWVLISPLMNGGSLYRGLAATTLWPELNRRTT